MFSQLNAYADEEFCKQHPYFYIYTPDGTTKVYQVFSAGVVKAVAENYNLNYNTDEDFLNYLELCKNSSNYQVEADLHAAPGSSAFPPVPMCWRMSGFWFRAC